ncbi:MAG TPA: response regulator [Chloroflexia bacterium]|nr:response regulator [Chloroflexia bacterium]
MSNTVLLIEDNQDLSEIISDGILAAGDTPVAVYSRTRALHVLRTTPCELIILDYDIPDLDAAAFLAELKGPYPAIPVLILTAQPSRVTFNSQVVAVLERPFSLNRLLGKVDLILHQDLDRSFLRKNSA